jgi:hypothetical protein
MFAFTPGTGEVMVRVVTETGNPTLWILPDVTPD